MAQPPRLLLIFPTFPRLFLFLAALPLALLSDAQAPVPHTQSTPPHSPLLSLRVGYVLPGKKRRLLGPLVEAFKERGVVAEMEEVELYPSLFGLTNAVSTGSSPLYN